MDAEEILESWGLSRIAKALCRSLGLQTMEDIKSLSDEIIDGLDIKPVQKKILKELRDLCVSGNYEEERRRRQRITNKIMREPAHVGNIEETSIDPVDIRTLLCRIKQI